MEYIVSLNGYFESVVCESAGEINGRVICNLRYTPMILYLLPRRRYQFKRKQTKFNIQFSIFNVVSL